MSDIVDDDYTCDEIPDSRFYTETPDSWIPRTDLSKELMVYMLTGKLESGSVRVLDDKPTTTTTLVSTDDSTPTTESVEKKSSRISKATLIRSLADSVSAENFIEPGKMVPELAFARAMYYRFTRRAHYRKNLSIEGGPVHLRYPLSAESLSDLMKNKKCTDETVINASNPPTQSVIMYPVNIFAGAERLDRRAHTRYGKWAGNHYVAVVIDSRSKPGVIYYWDPLGNRLKLDELRCALCLRFPGFVFRDEPIKLQNDSINCPFWVMIYFIGFICWMNDEPSKKPKYYDIISTQQFANFYDLTAISTKERRDINQTFIDNYRDERMRDISIVRDDERLESVFM